MPLVPFSAFLDGEGLTFGLPTEVLEKIQDDTDGGQDLGSLLCAPALARVGVGADHLLRIRRAFWRFQALEKLVASAGVEGTVRCRLEVQAAGWARRAAPVDPEKRIALAGALAGLVAETLKRGRLRFLLKNPDDPRTQEITDLSQRSEGCADIPPHRWFKASRAVADGLLWIEVIPPEGQVKMALGTLDSPELRDDLSRAAAKAVLDGIAERSEREVIATAANALRAMLARPRLAGAVAGVVQDQKRCYAAVLGGEGEPERAEFDRRHSDRLAGWLVERSVAHVGLARVGSRGHSSELMRVLPDRGLTVEPVREVGLMKQARGMPGPLKLGAAVVVAMRLRDPAEGYADLEPDELGLGEYLDRVDATRLRAALEDARQAALCAQTKQQDAGLARGVTANPMVRGLEDLRPGLELGGTVSNLTHFGAFVELGLEIQGLVHLSELSDSFVKHPSEVVQVGQKVRVRIVEVDLQRRRIGLSLRGRGDARRKRPRSQRSESIKALDDLFKK